MNTKSLILASFVYVLGASVLTAQPHKVKADRSVMEFDAKWPANELVVTGKPYSGTFTEYTRPYQLPESAAMTRTIMMYRDSQGRTMSSPAYLTGFDFSTALTLIVDPVEGYWYLLDSKTMIAHKSVLPQNTGHPRPGQPGFTTFQQKPAPTLIPLGQRTLLGVETTGTLQTSADAKLTIERWYSAEAGLQLLGRVNNPNRGLGITQFTELHRDEPPASTFQVPIGYRVVSEPEHFALPKF